MPPRLPVKRLPIPISPYWFNLVSGNTRCILGINVAEIANAEREIFTFFRSNCGGWIQQQLAASADGAHDEHCRSLPQTSVCAEISRASSTPIPRYRTVLSDLCPEVHRLENTVHYGQVAAKHLRTGLGWANDTIRLSTHGTTHVDAPWHYGAECEGKPARTML